MLSYTNSFMIYRKIDFLSKCSQLRHGGKVDPETEAGHRPRSSIQLLHSGSVFAMVSQNFANFKKRRKSFGWLPRSRIASETSGFRTQRSDPDVHRVPIKTCGDAKLFKMHF